MFSNGCFKTLINSTDQVTRDHVVLGATVAVDTGRKAEAAGEGLFQVECGKNVLDVLGFLAHAQEILVLVTVAHVFGFDEDAVDNRSVECQATRYRNDEVVGEVHEGGFGEDVYDVRYDREVGLQRSVVLNVGIAVIHDIEEVAAVGELNLELFDTGETVEIECCAEVALIQVFGLADKGDVCRHVIRRGEAELQLVFRNLGGEEAVQSSSPRPEPLHSNGPFG